MGADSSTVTVTCILRTSKPDKNGVVIPPDELKKLAEQMEGWQQPGVVIKHAGVVRGEDDVWRLECDAEIDRALLNTATLPVECGK